MNTRLKKADGALQVVYVELYPPDVVDSQSDFMTRDELRRSAWDFLRKGKTNVIDVNHDGKLVEAYVCESFIARDGDPDFIPHSWVVGIHIPDPVVWKMVEAGELNGISMEAFGVRRPIEIEVDIPDVVTGVTTNTEGHEHRFSVRFGPEGSFLGGETEPAEDGHSHRIVKGTVTEPGGNGHTHRFSVVEGMIND